MPIWQFPKALKMGPSWFYPELELDRMYNYGGSNYDYLLRAIYEPTKQVYYVLGSSYSIDQDLPATSPVGSGMISG